MSADTASARIRPTPAAPRAEGSTPAVRRRRAGRAVRCAGATGAGVTADARPGRSAMPHGGSAEGAAHVGGAVSSGVALGGSVGAAVSAGAGAHSGVVAAGAGVVLDKSVEGAVPAGARVDSGVVPAGADVDSAVVAAGAGVGAGLGRAGVAPGEVGLTSVAPGAGAAADAGSVPADGGADSGSGRADAGAGSGAGSAGASVPGARRAGAAVSPDRIGVIVTEPRAVQAPRRSGWSRALRKHFGTFAGVVILAVLLWRMGTGVFLDGLRRIDAPALLAALGIGAVTTVFSAWRWALVARGLRIRLPLGQAVADYYRSLFLNAALPGGILGDVHRAVRHGQSEGDVGRGVRAVVLERTAGQLVLAVAGVTVLLILPSPVMADVRHVAPPAALGAVGALAVVLAVRMNSPARRRGGRLRTTLSEAREGLLSRRNGPGVALSSAVVLTGHLATFVVAARVGGSTASVLVLLPLAVLALLAMSLPLNVGGWGPREGVTAWAFGAAGLGASTGLSVAVVYGALSFAAALPGAVVLVVRWYTGLRAKAAAGAGAGGAGDVVSDAESGHAHDGHYPRSAPEDQAPALSSATASTSAPASAESAAAVSAVSIEKYAPKESARLARSSFPFSADPREGRPMTPESV